MPVRQSIIRRKAGKDIASSAGFSFVEVIITAAVSLILFGGIFSTFNIMTKLAAESKMKLGALALAQEKMEYLRSLSYSELGTVGGVPAGLVPQESTTVINSIEYTERVLITYVDDPADGEGLSDSNGIINDYKQIKVEYSWSGAEGVRRLALVSNVVPRGIESTEGGGTVRVNVFDAAAAPVAGATVRFINNSLAPPIDTSRVTGPEGVAYLAGAPEGAGYEISVTKSGFSTDGTTVPSTENPNPTTPPVAVLESQVSTMNFQIDQLSSLTLVALEEAIFNSFEDSFATSTLIATSSNIFIDGSSAMLDTDGSGDYFSSGSFLSTVVSPAPIDSWYGLYADYETSADTGITIFVYFDNGGVAMLVPEEDLPGNLEGFTTTPVDLTGLDTATYPSLVLRADLATTAADETPRLNHWELRYIESQTPLSGESITITGTKVVGVDAASQPIRKYEEAHVTDGNGRIEIPEIEWDTYRVSIDSATYRFSEICPTSPLVLAPDSNLESSLSVVSTGSPALLVMVTDSMGAPIAEANATLARPGILRESVSSFCGQVFFDESLVVEADYELTVSKPGYGTEVFTDVNVEIDQAGTFDVVLAP